MSPSCAKPPEQGPPFPHLRIAFASRTGAVKAASWAPEGSLDGWPRCRTISHEGNGGHVVGAVMRHFYFAQYDISTLLRRLLSTLASTQAGEYDPSDT